MATHPAQDISGVLTATGLHTYINGVRAHLMRGYDGMHEASAVLRRGIERSGGGQWWAMGVDLRWAARKITRPIDHAADLQMEAAKALCTSWELYVGQFGAMSQKAGAGTFDHRK